MRKINVSLRLSAYAASLFLSVVLVGGYAVISTPPTTTVPEIPVIHMDAISAHVPSSSKEEAIEAATAARDAADDALPEVSNPFSAIPKAGANVAKLGMGPGMAPPTPPSVPSMPGSSNRPDIPIGNVGANYSPASEKLEVIGVLPPDVVILRRGGETVTARSGSDTEFGHIGTVTSIGCYVDDSFVMLK